ncbi:carotenoid isomerooxygenase-like isoform X2 [Mercenaria mercenaria]|nr:carotenoid isomerooxygenase-like isoform X2 [Mercenaria mercenaria]XP_045188572.2 carotenoid isomerooxygenase-like isoform X2 [Mercenaria mercenaria]XP_045188574.2 carotenoid isomerooxygenase-like isoform X2 [Mercenaria mercenaria]XP_053406720.1 carotenoid isomerooxygenase-like isoform X2 [Mercenaria mercenaria]XP_053406721.1 carotenoid isomerooxygenase-like isoform X2 [Mercenaria mercenaria]
MMQLDTIRFAVLSCLTILAGVSTYTEEDLADMLKDGFRNVDREIIDGEVMVEYGSIPTWLSGNFMRHACGAFGESDNMNDTLPNYIEHLFDCMEIGSKFRVENGKITFTQRWYNTTVNDIYNSYGREMNKSSYFMKSTFSKINKAQFDKWESNLSDTSKVAQVPSVSWWQIGNEAIAMTEKPVGVIIDTHCVSQKGWIQYKDNNMGIPDTPQYYFTNNPAHAHTEPDGTLWSASIAVNFVSGTRLKISRLVYKVDADKFRHVVGTYNYEDADLSRCRGWNPYPDFSSRFGYIHSFCMTENYIILPETGYMHDPCFYRRYDKHMPFFPQSFHYEPNGFVRLLVMRKSDGEFIANITMPPFFVTHQLGSYEDGDLIHMDMLTYNNADVYAMATLNDLYTPYTTNVSRITINMTDFTASMRSLRNPARDPAAFEMSNINYAYYGKKYKYGYMARNIYRKERNALTKLNVDTGEEIQYTFPEGMFVQEPQFVPRPNSTAEDDGVVIAQGVDGRKHKAFMVIVDAKTMNLIGHVTAPDLALFGLHNRFYPLDGGRTYVTDTAPNHSLNAVLVLCFLYLYMLLHTGN